MATTTQIDYDVVIAGAGPTGLTLANHLGTLGVRTLVLEKLPTLIDYPRGVGVDDEALRSFQAVGLVDAVRRHTVPNQIMRFVDRRGRVLAAIAPTAQPFGWPRRSGFIQPLVDRELAEGLKRFSHVSLQMQRSVTGFAEFDGGIRVDVQPVDAQGEPVGELRGVTARYLVGCDGGRSPVRTALGLPFDGKSESTKWLVIDIADEPIGTPNVHFVLDDEFPHVVLALPHGVLRYEFMVPAGADDATFESDDNVRKLLARVLPGHVKPNVIRRRVYMHHARIAPTFRRGRALLAGDAAHLMPVWQGQGFNTGIRDASNLGWKLALIVKGRAGDALLDTYTQERHAHAGAMIDLSVLVGKIFVPSNPLLRVVRNVVGPWLSKLPSLRQYIAEMRFKPMPFFSEGVVAHGGTPDPKGQVGKVFMQPRVADANGTVRRLDDAIGLRFALLSWSARADAWIDAEARLILDRLGALPVVVRPDCQSLDREPPQGGVVLADTEGAFKLWFDEARGGIVILRPDRIVAAVCKPWELSDTLRGLAQRMQLDLSDRPAVAAEPTVATTLRAVA
ncbi:bifunctional 3-(3-hydroxy-phenyl)propionate/3-hydroxycinnamic acid hydroxylase [Piscinibacter sp.]|uniref:bifunctional 3-(3-hydroxy-phenyl)propionate/3-hydroxycinnamic acid hydroxylase n=1 Tax=Piscinibacter sp. TaxID=1903157 RepID=UPI002C11A82F|nr:bifunctional 3-(3-hydroxy-phenyl)propionate/3-hydroxycinnamic acid hydroxylase [Albitalea sp.]HUG22178.1 bifunctional 3-(3-hydroxy-phenyl)propionate/3-hydroxycinnamic acid hydroxylase [Albitalea sp.]